MNSINLTGNVCNELELKSTPSGKPVLAVNLAVKRPFTKDITDFIPLVVWEKNAEFLSRYGKKGSKVAVSGKLTTRKYQDSNGNNRTIFEVVCDAVELLDSKSESGNHDAPTYAKAPTAPKFEDIKTDEALPF